MRPSRLFNPAVFYLRKKGTCLINNNNTGTISPITWTFFFRSFTCLNSKETKKPSTKSEPLSSQSLHLPYNNNHNHHHHHLKEQTRFSSFWFSKKTDFIFRQLFDYSSFTYTYLLADSKSKDGVLIDPVLENVNRDLRIIKDLGVNLLFAMNTHVHADHITGSGILKEKIKSCKSLISVESQAKADDHFKHGDLIQFGNFQLECRSTPGHTNGCYSFVWHEKSLVFTGDAVLIRGCGRTDFQQGDSEKLYESVQQQIFSLPSDYLIFPAHDYTGQMMSTIGEEKEFNPRLSKSKSEFVKTMQQLELPYPKQIDKALPANLLCGIQPVVE